MSFEFLPTDRDWSDYHTGLSPERAKRYEEVLDAIIDELDGILKRNNKGHHVLASVPTGIFAVGTKGDGRIYAPFVLLTLDAPAYGLMDSLVLPIKRTILDTLPISHVVVRLDAYLVPHGPNVYHLKLTDGSVKTTLLVQD